MNTDTPSQTSQQRSRTFANDPLHSAAYLNGIKTYLAMGTPLRSTIPIASATASFRFLYRYELRRAGTPSTGMRTHDVYNCPENFRSSVSAGTEASELVFLTGYPSRQWLKEISSHYNIDFRFLQSHLDFLPGARRDWFLGSSIPSRNRHCARLLIPSIVFFDSDVREISVRELHEARSSCHMKLREKVKNFFGDSTIQHGQSIIRRINIHSGDMMVIEQAVSISINNTASGPRVIVWSDAGDPEDSIVTPNTPRFQKLSSTADFCPVFFDRGVQSADDTNITTFNVSVNGNIIPRTLQPLAVLPSRYGETLDWNEVSTDPLSLLEELFRFQASAASQYLNMLRDLTTERLAQTPPTGETLPSMDDILHLDYTKTVLIRWSAHFKTLVGVLNDHVFHVEAKLLKDDDRRLKLKLSLLKDLEFLQAEAETLITVCDSGKSTIMNLSTVFDSRQAAKDSSLVTELTKATNRITFIFLPISFVTSVFGMNFRQFGQGPLSITIWFAVALPLLSICIFLTERKAWLKSWRSLFTTRTKASGGLQATGHR
ncbi:uncharacterized protein M421DRAFT_426173 [Didymella exigua CBS 183.55]|uniref:Cora-domain-containing protein n=1 Tax=Didymella exigua CBS 183.55 TaxID=1150837 RepID=A0A6A5R5T0_9PLEO|nr:uncharacterized protein M421DRAFT_426173 [Didymella exigua CBS 183.55]KAF1923072.1 hypothetical protein M421DRAFT_426173 [Didymella exigua CBS 183.55]